MRVAIDLHGVLVDFAGPCRTAMGFPENYNRDVFKFFEGFMSEREFTSALNDLPASFWRDLPFYGVSSRLLDMVSEISTDHAILSHCASDAAKSGSDELVRNAFGDVRAIFVDKAHHKARYVEDFDVLIDDRPENVSAFTRNGGVGILWGKGYNADCPADMVRVNGLGELRKVLLVLSQTILKDERSCSIVSEWGPTWEEDARPVQDVCSCPIVSGWEPTWEEDTNPEKEKSYSGETRVVNSETGGEKCAKPIRIDLIPSGAMEELGKVYHFGTTKYAPHNFRRGYDFSLSIAAMYRHLNAWNGGEDSDPESGLSHLGHAAWHCMALLQNQLDFGSRFDDRYAGEGAEVEAEETSDFPLQVGDVWEDGNGELIGPLTEDGIPTHPFLGSFRTYIPNGCWGPAGVPCRLDLVKLVSRGQVESVEGVGAEENTDFPLQVGDVWEKRAGGLIGPLTENTAAYRSTHPFRYQSLTYMPGGEWDYDKDEPTTEDLVKLVSRGQIEAEETSDFPIQVGDVWEDGNGDLFGPLMENTGDLTATHPFLGGFRTYTPNGCWGPAGAASNHDLVKLVSRNQPDYNFDIHIAEVNGVRVETRLPENTEIPEGYEVIGFREPAKGDLYLNTLWNMVMTCGLSHPHQHPRAILRKRGEDE